MKRKRLSQAGKSKTEVIQVIRQWLKEENKPISEIEDAYADLNLVLQFNPKDALNIIIGKKEIDSILIATQAHLSEIDQKAFARLDKTKKSNFTNALGSALVQLNVPYQISPSLDEIKYVYVQRKIYFDGLTKDRFFDTITKVELAVVAAKLCYQKYLSLG